MADDKPFQLKLDVRGELDTAMPIGDRPHGTLVAATDLDSKSWGPRRGSQRFTGVWEGPGTASLYDAIDLTTGASTYGQALSYEDQFRDLGTKWTLDLWFRIPSTAYAAGKDKVGLYKFLLNSSGGVIEVSVTGPAAGQPAHMQVYVVTNPTTVTTDTPVTFVCNSAISIGSTQADKHHFRITRNGANINCYLDGVNDDPESPSSLVATSGIIAASGTAAIVGLGNQYIGTDLTVTLKGQIFGAWLRDGGQFSSLPIENRFPCSPQAKNVRHAYLGRNYSLGGSDHYFDASRFGAHARINGAGYTVTASNDNTAPAPAPVQGIRTWTTRTNRTASSVMVGGQLSTSAVP